MNTISMAAFAYCENINDVYCYSQNVDDTYNYLENGICASWNAFDNSYIEYATLHVPASSIDKYKEREPWNKFGSIVALKSGEDPNEPEITQCAKPNISFQNGEITFSTSTEGAEYFYTINDADVESGKYTKGNVSLKAALEISVYAVANGYLKSETATATLHWLTGSIEGADGIQEICADRRPILVSSSNGAITVKGLTDGERVQLYTLNGQYLGQAEARGDEATLNATTSGCVVVKIGNETVKVMLK